MLSLDVFFLCAILNSNSTSAAALSCLLFLANLSIALLSSLFFPASCLYHLSEDGSANPNKRVRAPALLGDHPPEYGKALRPTHTCWPM